MAVPLHESWKVRVQGPQMEEFALPTQAFQGIARLQPQPPSGLGRLAGTDMGQDLVLGQNTLRIVAYNAAGQANAVPAGSVAASTTPAIRTTILPTVPSPMFKVAAGRVRIPQQSH